MLTSAKPRSLRLRRFSPTLSSQDILRACRYLAFPHPANRQGAFWTRISYGIKGVFERDTTQDLRNSGRMTSASRIPKDVWPFNERMQEPICRETWNLKPWIESAARPRQPFTPASSAPPETSCEKLVSGVKNWGMSRRKRLRMNLGKSDNYRHESPSGCFREKDATSPSACRT